MSEWHPIEDAPWGVVVEVRNKVMDYPVRASRGYVAAGVVHRNTLFFTSHCTPDPGGIFHTPPGGLICPTEWRYLPQSEDSHDE